MDRTGARWPGADDHTGGAARLVGAFCVARLGVPPSLRGAKQRSNPARRRHPGLLRYARNDDQSTLPGLRMPFGSSRCLRSRISANATGSFTDGNRSRLTTPMPCSAEIEPPYFFTTANTTALTSSQRRKYSALSAPTGWVTL